MTLKSTFLKKTGIFVTAFYKEAFFLTIKDSSGFKKNYTFDFSPYFYLISVTELVENDFIFLKENLKGIIEIIKTKKSNMSFVYKLIFKDVDSLVLSKHYLNESYANLSSNYSLFEADIPFLSRAFMDLGLTNFKKIEYIAEGDHILSFKLLDDLLLTDIDYFTFDLEILPPSGTQFPTPKDSPIISIAAKFNNENYFFILNNSDEIKEKELKKYFVKDKVLCFTDEVKLIKEFALFFGQTNPDVIFTYNGDGFDFEYLFKRYKVLTFQELTLNGSSIIFSKRGSRTVSVDGMVHVDVYVLIKLLNYLQVFNYSKFDLNSIYTKITGKPKLEMPPTKMRFSYLNFNLVDIAKYNLDDVIATEELGKDYLTIVYEISKLIYTPVFDVLRSSAGFMVERWFMNYYVKNNLLIPNKPTSEQLSERYAYTFTGAYVKDPISGLHKNIAIVDFRSYHISLIITYNLSPETMDVDDSGEEILGHKISKKIKGFVPSLLSELLNIRIPIKEKMKTLDKTTQEYRAYYAKQYALKILLASTYGYMGFSGARWYCRSCLNVMYHLVRTKIQEIITNFEEMGYQVIYGDTDSCFLHFENIDKLKDDLEKVNKSLPKAMSLELEEIFKTGIFVMSRDKEKAAKKKYALLSTSGDLKIKGFELVRRDWCPLVKETQRQVLKLVLKEEDPKSAIEYIKTKVKELQEHKVPLEKLVIQSIIHKTIKSYKLINPAMSAYINAKENGIILKRKEVIEYIITDKQGKSISEKARIIDLVSEKDYDVDYYLNNQLIPSILPIIEVFNISKDELLTGKKQTGLNQFF